MRMLSACAFSGIDRDAFASVGFNAWSIDILPTERPGQHIVGDLMALLYEDDGVTPSRWSSYVDVMVAHPPCTYLANSGVRWLYGGKGTERDPARWALMEEAAAFFKRILEHPLIPHIAVENPVMHGYGRDLIGRGPDQIVQPWMFGHPETKATGFWLKGLPLLKPTDIVEGREPRVHHASPGPDRWKERSRALPRISMAMARQWGGFVLGKEG